MLPAHRHGAARLLLLVIVRLVSGGDTHPAQLGEPLAVDLDTGVIEDKTTGETFTAAPFPPFIQKIIAVGGIENFVREKIAGKA